MSIDTAKMEKYIQDRIRFGNSSSDIKFALVNMNNDLDPNFINTMVDNVCNSYPDYNLIQKIMRSKIVKNICDPKDMYIVDSANKNREKISPENLKGLFNPKFNTKDREYLCRFTYRPDKNTVVFRSDDGGCWNYNTYEPPFWYSDHFYSGGKVEVPKVSSIPELYKKFLMHLVNQDERSFNYILDWISNAIHRRNYCILTTIGNQGVGKGVLGDIMREIFGGDNFYCGTDSVFKKSFNSQIGQKKLFYCDEISIKNKEHEDRLKVVVNDHIEIERKFKDAEEIKNFTNLYVSSNNVDAIRLTADDRRFSIVNLTDVKLNSIMDDLEIKSLMSRENIVNLAYYLYHREYDLNAMNKVFITERTETVRESILSEWQDWFLNEYCADNAGKEIKQAALSDVIEDKYGTKYRPGRVAFSALQALYPKKFSVSKKTVDGKRVWMILINKDQHE